MSKIHSYVLSSILSLVAITTMANAAGTYYTGSAYQPVQYRYGQSGATYTQSNYGRTTAASTTPYVRYNTGYSGNVSGTTQRQANNQSSGRSTQQKAQSSKTGFFVNAGISHENASWHFNMKESGSVLQYDNVGWNLLDLNGGYVFGLGNKKMQVDAGFKYGIQGGKSSMIDDDVTNGGYDVTLWKTPSGTIIGQQVGHSLSVGTSKDGTMLGFNAGLGLNDFMKFGNLKITPSVGYRYFKYKLQTRDNHALSVDTSTTAGGCYVDDFGQTTCDPVYIFYNSNGDKVIVTRDHINGTQTGSTDDVPVPSGFSYVYAGGTAYYYQPGTSHSYNAEWSGPYIAMDMVYDINENNSMNGRFEFGLPGYKATGDQPYRWDWAHPKSVEDSANMFSAIHLGIGANWKTAISNSVALSLGLTYDYYSVSGADAKTYLNQDLYNQLANKTDRTEIEEIQKRNLENARQDCGGWVCSASKEIDSVYKSMGVRVGIDAWF